MQSIKIDTEFQNLIPPLTEEEYRQLEENLIKEGCRDSLVIWNGTMIDGHNRYKICTKHNIPFNTTEMKFADRDKAIEWIIKNQFGRRNISTAQRCELVLKLEDVIKAKAKEKQKEHGDTAPGKSLNPKSDEVIPEINTNKELAKLAGVGHNTIYQYRTIKKEGAPDLQQKVLKNEVSINKAYRMVRPKPPKSEEKEETRICIVCNKEKPISEFYGRGNECKECNSSRKLLKLSRGEARKLNELYPDEEVERYYEEMKNPALRQEEAGNTEIQDNPIITEYLELINSFNQNIGKFMYMPQVKGSKTAMELTEETIKILTNIKSEE